MPEAAEVTVAAAQLALVATGRRIERLEVRHPRAVRSVPDGVLPDVSARVVSSVTRHGKWIVIGLDDGSALGVHLRMSGQLLAASPGTPESDRHVHVVWHLGERPGPPLALVGVPLPPDPTASGVGVAPVEVRFRDPRTFGEVRPLPAGAPVAADLHDPVVTGASLVAAAQRRRVGVKAVLLDQVRTVSGIGSYLADEALHDAGIDPRAPAGELHPQAWERILHAARRISSDAAAAGGVTLPDEGWVDLWGRPGRYAASLVVHGWPQCGACGAPTRRTVVGGRSARWCPTCQPARRRR